MQKEGRQPVPSDGHWATLGYSFCCATHQIVYLSILRKNDTCSDADLALIVEYRDQVEKKQHPPENSRLLWNETSFWWCFLGTFSGALATISFVQTVWQLGLEPLPAQIVQYYRGMVEPIRSTISWLAPLKLPDWYVDCYLLSCISMLAFARAFVETAIEEAIRNLGASTLSASIRAKLLFVPFLVGMVMAIVVSLLLLGLAMPLAAFLNVLDHLKRPSDRRNTRRPPFKFLASVSDVAWPRNSCVSSFLCLELSSSITSTAGPLD